MRTLKMSARRTVIVCMGEICSDDGNYQHKIILAARQSTYITPNNIYNIIDNIKKLLNID